MKILIVCVLGLAVCLGNATEEKRNAPYPRSYTPKRQSWTCHPGCKRFCLPSCKKSCCGPSAPNYTPQMFPQLIQYQSTINNPPQLPPACPANCNPSCYPNCDPGCCAFTPMNNQASHYGNTNYGNNQAGCSPACAPAYRPACCHSQPVQPHVRPMVPGAPIRDREQDHHADKPKPVAPKPAKKSEKINDGKVCLRKCQNLCNPICRFECCLPTHRYFDDDPKPAPVVHHEAPKVDKKKEQLKAKLRDPQYIHPIAGPQRARFPSMFRATPAKPNPCQSPQGAQGPDPCFTPTTSPFGATTDPFGPTTDMFSMFSSPYTQGYATQSPQGSCAAPCPQSCAPSCSPSCCQTQSPMMPQPAPMMPMPPPMPVAPAPMAPMYGGSPGLKPIGQAPTTCSAGCSNICAPACSQACCQEFPQVIHVPPATAAAAVQRAASPGLSPMGQAPTTCPGMCPNTCAPACSPMCCTGPAPQVVHVAAVHPASSQPMHLGSPGLKPLGMASTCPGSCPNNCAPTCSVACCAAQAPPPMTCPGINCPNSCAPACTPSCCAQNDDLLPANWDKRSFIKKYWRRYY